MMAMPQEAYYNELKIAHPSMSEHFIGFLLELGVDGVEEQENLLIVRSCENLEIIQWGVEEFAQKLSKTLKQEIKITTSLTKKSNEDWIQKYKESIKPIQVGDFYIRPSWEKSRDGLKNIIIDPALAFGSGHHESTSGCLKMLEKYLKKDDTLLDVGCGSGILSIASLKLGAVVDCCDTDEQAIMSTRSNMKLNSVTCKHSWVGSVNKREMTYDFVVANIIADILIILAKDLIASVNGGGTLILSGILLRYQKRIYEEFKKLEHIETLEDKEWCTIVFKKGLK